ncbi:MAG: hypothetical protein V4719_22275 [Planctomycetota bacterium]
MKSTQPLTAATLSAVVLMTISGCSRPVMPETAPEMAGRTELIRPPQPLPVAPLLSSYHSSREAIVFYGNHFPPGKFAVDADAVHGVVNEGMRVKEVILGSCVIRPGAILEMRQLADLRRLSLIACELDKAVLDELSNLQQLQSLSLAFSNLAAEDEDVVEILSGLNQLESIELTVSSQVAQRLSERLPTTVIKRTEAQERGRLTDAAPSDNP